jgi:hypothetical protein
MAKHEQYGWGERWDGEPLRGPCPAVRLRDSGAIYIGCMHAAAMVAAARDLGIPEDEALWIPHDSGYVTGTVFRRWPW